MKLRKLELFISILVTLISIGVYYYLFAIADRRIVFLYGHLGHTPFDQTTTGRYWMIGFILSGFLAILYLITRLIVRFLKITDLNSWSVILKRIVFPLIAGVVSIMMFLGEPKLTFLMGISSAATLIIGIGLGFSVVDDLIKNYKSTFVYLVFGLGLVPFLVLFRSMELPGKGILPMNIAVWVIVATVVGGVVWLILFYRKFRNDRPNLTNVIKGTLAIGYIGLPLLHYLFATPQGIPYITTSENFFADHLTVRLVNWILLVLIAFSVDRFLSCHNWRSGHN